MLAASMKALSLDLRTRVVAAVDGGELTQAEVAARFSVTPRFVSKLLKQRRERGHVEPLARGGGRTRRVDLAGLAAAVEAQNDVTLSELQRRVPATDGASLSQASISHWLIHLGLGRKKDPACPGGRRRGA